MTGFDERAKDWDNDPAKVERAQAVANAMRARITFQPAMRALEYGCGTGLLSFALQQDFASINLADTSQGMLDVLAGKIQSAGLGHLHPLHLDLASEPAPLERFDIIYSLMTMHHIPQTETVLLKFHTLLNPGGTLCITDLEKEDGSFHGPSVTDVHRGFERARLQHLVEAAGFGGVRFSSVYIVKKQVDGREMPFPLFLMMAQKKQ
jgi:ubiquinone/menaquinone biosynthesis C-methylase UbiE